MKNLEEVGFNETSVPTGYCYENDKGVLVFFEDGIVTVVPLKRRTENDNVYYHANFTLDEIEAIYNKIYDLYGKMREKNDSSNQ